MSYSALQQAITLCQELVSLLEAENAHIRANNTAAVAEATARKETLMIAFQDALKLIKKDLAAIKAHPSYASLHGQLKDLLLRYNEVARRNVVLLQAAHTSASSFINIVRQAMQPPAPQVYGKDGNLREALQHHTPLLAKSV